MTDDLHERLARERRKLELHLAQLRGDFDGIVAASQDDNADDEHDPEGATIAFERSQIDALVRQAEQRLGEVDAAELRLAAGTYGVCVVCGRPVGPDRLGARPTAATCIACAR